MGWHETIWDLPISIRTQGAGRDADVGDRFRAVTGARVMVSPGMEKKSGAGGVPVGSTL